MITIKPYEPEHLSQIDFQSSQIGLLDNQNDDYAISLKNAGPAYTAFVGDKIICCAGLSLMWDNRAIGWVKLSKDSGRNFVAIHKAVKLIIDSANCRRVEAYVASDFKQGKRWVKMLGMSYEGKMKAFSPDGRDHNLYAIIYGDKS